MEINRLSQFIKRNQLLNHLADPNTYREIWGNPGTLVHYFSQTLRLNRLIDSTFYFPGDSERVQFGGLLESRHHHFREWGPTGRLVSVAKLTELPNLIAVARKYDPEYYYGLDDYNESLLLPNTINPPRINRDSQQFLFPGPTSVGSLLNNGETIINGNQQTTLSELLENKGCIGISLDQSGEQTLTLVRPNEEARFLNTGYKRAALLGCAIYFET